MQLHPLYHRQVLLHPTKFKSGSDLNNDGDINMSDVIILASEFDSIRASSRYNQAYDLNNDGDVNMSDIMTLATRFNTKV